MTQNTGHWQTAAPKNPSTGMVKTRRGIFGGMAGLPPWLQLSILLTIIFASCALGGQMAAKDQPETGNPGSSPAVTGSPAAAESPAAVPVRESANVTGNGEELVELGPTLSGNYKVEYAFGSWCGAISFLNAAGESAEVGSWGIGINGCSSSTDIPLSGSQMVKLDGATMIQTQNTRGNWMVKFTPV